MLVDALSTHVGRQCIIRLHDPVTSITREHGKWNVHGKLYDTVISTIPPNLLAGSGLPESLSIPYQGAACMLLSLDQDVTSGTYWLNMRERAPYGAVISHTNFVPVERYGERLVYLASYFQGTVPVGLDHRMIDDFCQRFHVDSAAVRWHRMAVDPYAGPLYTVNFRKKILPYEKNGLYLAGMFSFPNYPERSMNGAVVAGEEVADLVSRGVSG